MNERMWFGAGRTICECQLRLIEFELVNQLLRCEYHLGLLFSFFRSTEHVTERTERLQRLQGFQLILLGLEQDQIQSKSRSEEKSSTEHERTAGTLCLLHFP